MSGSLSSFVSRSPDGRAALRRRRAAAKLGAMTSRTTRPLAVAMLLALTLACGSGPAPAEPQPAAPEPAAPVVEPPPPAPELAEWVVAEGHRGIHELSWRPVDRSKVPRNEEFVVEVVLRRDGEPVEGVTLQVSGYMPAHNHGLIQLPLVEEQGEGRYLVEGLLLHMRGDWQLRFQVLAGRDTESFTFELKL